MLVEVQLATALVSFGTLVALWIVCNVQLSRRYFPDIQLRFTRCRGSAGLHVAGACSRRRVRASWRVCVQVRNRGAGVKS